MKYSHVFWDWNGTLIDDALVACNAVNAMLGARNLPGITFDQYREYIDVPIVKFYEKVMDMSAESMEALSVEFNAFCDKFRPDYPLFPETSEVLRCFAEKGLKQYIFSSSENRFIEPMLQRFGIADCFQAVLGASDCYVGSKAQRTRAYLESNAIDPRTAVFVGDMVHDSEVASFIGSDCILVAAGHQSPAVLRATGREVLGSLSELPSKIC